jgi:hypothetical protein
LHADGNLANSVNAREEWLNATQRLPRLGEHIGPRFGQLRRTLELGFGVVQVAHQLISL